MIPLLRDLLSVIYLEKRLSLLREDYLERSLSGMSLNENFIRQQEKVILQDMKKNFFSGAVQEFLRYSNSQDLSDEEDFVGRSQKLTERAVILTHRKLLAIPYVGQEGYTEY